MELLAWKPGKHLYAYERCNGTSMGHRWPSNTMPPAPCQTADPLKNCQSIPPAPGNSSKVSRHLPLELPLNPTGHVYY